MEGGHLGMGQPRGQARREHLAHLGWDSLGLGRGWGGGGREQGSLQFSVSAVRGGWASTTLHSFSFLQLLPRQLSLAQSQELPVQRCCSRHSSMG